MEKVSPASTSDGKQENYTDTIIPMPPDGAIVRSARIKNPDHLNDFIILGGNH